MQDESFDRIVESLGQINVNLEGLRVTLAGLSEVTADHENRLRHVEQWKNSLSPLIALMTFLLGVVVSAVVENVL